MSWDYVEKPKKKVISPDEFSPYFGKDDEPEFFKRTLTKYKSMPLSQLKKMGCWHDKLDGIIPNLPEGAWIAGGFLRSIIGKEKEFAGDIDFFFNGSLALEQMVEYLTQGFYSSSSMKEAFGGYKPNMSIVKYINGSYRLLDFIPVNGNKQPIQLIKLKWFNSPESVIDSFDFTATQLIMDSENLYYGLKTFDDIENKVLRFHRINTPHPIVSLNRILKYREKGYVMENEQFEKIANSAVETILGKSKEKTDQFFYISGDKTTKNYLEYAWKYLQKLPETAKIMTELDKNKVKEFSKKLDYY